MIEKRIINLTWLIVFPFMQCESPAQNNKDNQLINDKVIVQHLNYPWEITWGNDNYIWMTEREGRISRVDPVTGRVFPLLTISETVSTGEGGMLGMALHPDFKNHPEVFVAYEYDNGSSYKEKVVRFTYNKSGLINPVTIIDNITGYAIHNGCRLLITPDLKLFITTGDAGNQSNPQNTSSLNGKILRINLDGTIPSDNPVAGNPYWTFGHRNPQGIVFANNILYSAEHGPSTDDEINIINKGKNYGWPNIQGYCDDINERKFAATYPVQDPIKIWTPTAAICGLDYYNKDLIPGWKNSLLVVALKNARLYQLKLNNTFNSIIETHEYLTNAYGRLRDICISPEGKVYVCTSNGGNNDKIIEINNNR